jgi:hypothetical protein
MQLHIKLTGYAPYFPFVPMNMSLNTFIKFPVQTVILGSVDGICIGLKSTKSRQHTCRTFNNNTPQVKIKFEKQR